MRTYREYKADLEQKASQHRTNLALADRLGRDRNRAAHLKRAYGITPDDYERMLQAQGGVCAICKRKPYPDENFDVDHAHETGLPRGILCASCNSAIGFLGDNAGRTFAAAYYLEKHAK